MATRYVRPGWFTINVFNRLAAGLTHAGISVLGSRILAVRAGCDAELRWGRRREPIAPVELEGDEKLPVLRAYVRRWKVEIGAFFQGVGPDAPDVDLARIAPGYPAFRVTAPRTPSTGG